MNYPLQDLLRVRQFREDKCAAEMTKRRRELEAAEQAVVERKQELEDYIEWRVRREAELYDEVMNQSIGIRDLDDLKLKIQLLRDDEAAYEERILQAERAVVDAQQALEDAHAAHQSSVRDRQKIDEHKGVWAQQAAREAEANQEKEMEDFRVRTLEIEEARDA